MLWCSEICYAPPSLFLGLTRKRIIPTIKRFDMAIPVNSIETKMSIMTWAWIYRSGGSGWFLGFTQPYTAYVQCICLEEWPQRRIWPTTKNSFEDWFFSFFFRRRSWVNYPWFSFVVSRLFCSISRFWHMAIFLTKRGNSLLHPFRVMIINTTSVNKCSISRYYHLVLYDIDSRPGFSYHPF